MDIENLIKLALKHGYVSLLVYWTNILGTEPEVHCYGLN